MVQQPPGHQLIQAPTQRAATQRPPADSGPGRSVTSSHHHTCTPAYWQEGMKAKRPPLSSVPKS